MYETLLYDSSDRIATITLNRPAKLNAYTPQMGVDLVHAFHRARDDEEVRVVILTGAGRGFCAGVDLDLLKQSRTGEEGDGPRIGEEDFVRSFPLELAHFEKPVIAAINGAAIGVGVTMSLPCDIRIAADTAKLGLTFTKLGILPGLGSTHLLPRLVGPARALELVLTARVIPASEAAEIGLVNKVVPADSLLKDAREMAGMMAAASPEVIRHAKRALLYGAGASLEEAMRNEGALGGSLRAARDKAAD